MARHLKPGHDLVVAKMTSWNISAPSLKARVGLKLAISSPCRVGEALNTLLGSTTRDAVSSMRLKESVCSVVIYTRAVNTSTVRSATKNIVGMTRMRVRSGGNVRTAYTVSKSESQCTRSKQYGILRRWRSPCVMQILRCGLT